MNYSETMTAQANDDYDDYDDYDVDGNAEDSRYRFLGLKSNRLSASFLSALSRCQY